MSQIATLSFFRFDRLPSRLWALAMMGAARPALAKIPDIGFWKLSEATVHRMTGRKEVEYRILPNLQDAIADGDRIGYLIEDEWLHLGGTEPTPEINTLRIARRVRQLEGLEAHS